MVDREPFLAFSDIIRDYTNTEAHNDYLFRLCTKLTWDDPVLTEHRRYVEVNNLGFGDPAFHAMWLRLLRHASSKFGHVHALEIGVYKGQVISLWSLIRKIWDLDLEVTCITPLVGQPAPRSKLIQHIRSKFDREFRENLANGNFYENDNFRASIEELFKRFGLPLSGLELIEGYSSDPDVLAKIDGRVFHIVYIDGDHSFDGSRHDFETFGRKVATGGFLVADDASCGLPGTAFWKGHETVSRAAEILPTIGFRNIVNIGHNRIYERIV